MAGGGGNRSQQMRWSRSSADLLLQVQCAVYNGTPGSGLGQWFQVALPLNYDGILLDCGYPADITVDDNVILELKSVEHIVLP